MLFPISSHDQTLIMANRAGITLRTSHWFWPALIVSLALLYYAILYPRSPPSTTDEASTFLCDAWKVLKTFSPESKPLFPDYQAKCLDISYAWEIAARYSQVLDVVDRGYHRDKQKLVQKLLFAFANLTDVGKKAAEMPRYLNDHTWSTFYNLVYQVNHVNLSYPNWSSRDHLDQLNEVIAMQRKFYLIFYLWNEYARYATYENVNSSIPYDQSYESDYLRERDNARYWRNFYFGTASDQEISQALSQNTLPCVSSELPRCLATDGYAIHLITSYARNSSDVNRQIEEEQARLETLVLQSQQNRIKMLEAQLKGYLSNANVDDR